VHWNHPQDKFEDAARQVHALDGWWTWFGNVNAQWLFAPDFFGRSPDPITYPNWEGTMVGWRHGKQFGANVLFRDGHVALVPPRRPQTIEEFRDPIGVTVDTIRVFTWLPGEPTTRFDWEEYRGMVEQWRGRLPARIAGNTKTIPGGDVVPPSYPEQLSVNWRTFTRSWKKLPNLDRRGERR